LLTFLFVFFIIFDQIPVFDVMLHLISPTRREAASPPSPPQLHAHRTYNSCLAVTLCISQLHLGHRTTICLSGAAGSLVWRSSLEWRALE
jgi:hypothetical protein